MTQGQEIRAKALELAVKSVEIAVGCGRENLEMVFAQVTATARKFEELLAGATEAGHDAHGAGSRPRAKGKETR